MKNIKENRFIHEPKQRLIDTILFSMICIAMVVVITRFCWHNIITFCWSELSWQCLIAIPVLLLQIFGIILFIISIRKRK